MSEKMVRDLAVAIADIRSPGVALDFLTGILTPAELKRIALRWRLVKLLKSGAKQRAIAEELGVSLCKITRGSRELKYGPEGFRKVAERAVKRDRKGATT